MLMHPEDSSSKSNAAKFAVAAVIAFFTSGLLPILAWIPDPPYKGRADTLVALGAIGWVVGLVVTGLLLAGRGLRAVGLIGVIGYLGFLVGEYVGISIDVARNGATIQGLALLGAMIGAPLVVPLYIGVLFLQSRILLIIQRRRAVSGGI